MISRRFAIKLVPTFLTLVCALSPRASFAAPAEKVLPFPNEHGYGALSRVTGKNKYEINVQRQPLGEAKGVFKIPATTEIYFEPGPKFFQNPQILLKLPHNSIEYINMQFTAMEDREDTYGDRAMGYLPHLTSLRGVLMDKSDTSDAGVSKLASLKNLEGISTTGSMVRGTFLKDLRNCRKLFLIRFGASHIDNDSLRYLKDYPNLKRLVFNRCNLMQQGIEHIAKCPKLESLDLSFNPRLTDKALETLTAVKSLAIINLRETPVSVAAIKKFAEARRPVIVIMPKETGRYSPEEVRAIRKIKGDLRFDNDRGNSKPDVKTLLAPVSR